MISWYFLSIFAFHTIELKGRGLYKHHFMFDVTSPKRCTDWNYPKVIRKCVVCGTWRGGKLRVRKEEHCQELTDMSWKSMLESPAWHDWLPSWQNIHRNVSHHCRWQPLKCQAGPVFVFLSKYFSLVLRIGRFCQQASITNRSHPLSPLLIKSPDPTYLKKNLNRQLSSQVTVKTENTVH